MNFTPEFYIPGVNTGATDVNKLEPITKYMTSVHKLITFTPEQNIGEVIEVLIKRKISGAPVLNDNQELVGMISEKDCLWILLDHNYYNCIDHSCKVKDYMSQDITTVPADANVIDIANLFAKTNFRRFPVVEHGRLVGQISRRDILRAAMEMKATTW